MSVDPRCRHDRSVRELAAGMFDEGRGCESVAKSLGIPAKAVRKWQQTYRAVGRDGLSDMGKTHASSSPLDRWCRLYREGGAEALGPKPKGRPRGSGSKAAPMTREQELEERVRRLEAQVAHPRKSMAPEAELRSRTGGRP
jgi:transposase-like protein